MKTITPEELATKLGIKPGRIRQFDRAGLGPKRAKSSPVLFDYGDALSWPTDGRYADAKKRLAAVVKARPKHPRTSEQMAQTAKIIRPKKQAAAIHVTVEINSDHAYRRN